MAIETPSMGGRLWEGLHSALHHSHTKANRIVQSVVWTLVVLSILSFWIELWVPLSPNVAWGMARFEEAALWVFALELGLRVLTFRPPPLDLFVGSPAWRLRIHVTGRIRYIFEPLVLIDVVTVLALVPALRGLRALRLLRLLAGIKFFKYSNPILGVLRSFSESWLLYSATLGFLLGVVVLGGLSLFLVEGGRNEAVKTTADGIWWAVVTITTVGYGDISPVTTAGRWVAGIIMVAGMFTLALFAGIVSTTLLQVVFRLREESFRMSNNVNHVVICGYDAGARMLLDAVLDEYPFDDRPEIVVFGPGDRPHDTPAELTWIRGDPTKESELDKVKLAYAQAVIVVGPRQKSIQQADATTLLTLFTMRSYMAGQKVADRRQRGIHVVAEILDQENVAHAYAAGADEVIQTTRFGFSLMAHALQAPGSGRVLEDIASTSAASVYVGRNPLVGPRTFIEMVEVINRRFGCTVMGFRDTRTGQVFLNPNHQQTVGPEQEIVYLAARPVLPTE